MKSINKVLVYLSILLIPFYILRFSIFGINTNIFEISVLIVFISTLIGQFRDSKQKNIEPTEYLVPGIILAVSLLAVFVGGFKIESAGIFKGWFLVSAVFAWIIVKNLDHRDLLKISLFLYLSLQIVAIFALFQKAGLVSTVFYQVGDLSFDQYLSSGRIFGFFESPNFLAMFIAPMIFLSLPVLKIVKKNSQKILILLSYLLPLLALYFTASRAGMIALIFSSFIAIFLFKGEKILNKCKPYFIAGTVPFFVLLNISYLFFSILNYKTSRGGDVIRIEIYKYSVQLIKSHPLFGIGLGKFQEQIGNLSSPDLSFQQFGLPYALHPHNLMMAVWLNLGVVGLIAFVWLLFRILRNAFDSDSYFRVPVIAALMTMLIHGLFDTTYFKNDLSVIFWLIFAESLIITKTRDYDAAKK